MELSSDLIADFVKATNDTMETKPETTVYGTIVEYNDSMYVRLDGSDLLTPVTAAANIKPGERVIVMIKNHTATIIGNISSPSASLNDIKDVSDIINKISEFETLVKDKVSSDELAVEKNRIDELEVNDKLFEKSIETMENDVDILQNNSLNIMDRVSANEAAIANLKDTKLDAALADTKYATIENLNAVYEKAFCMGHLSEIPANSDLNNYVVAGCYAVYTNDIATTIVNIPVQRAGRLEVWSATGEGVINGQINYLRQRFIPYELSNATWERDIMCSDDNTWSYGEWYRTSLSSTKSEQVYHEQILLWEGNKYMSAEDTIELLEAVNKQPNGIVLVFSKYDSLTDEILETDFNSFFVSKIFINSNEGVDSAFTMTDADFNCVCHKHLYINDTRIIGHDNNVVAGTGTSGITYANDKYILRYVYGI